MQKQGIEKEGSSLKRSFEIQCKIPGQRFCYYPKGRLVFLLLSEIIAEPQARAPVPCNGSAYRKLLQSMREIMPDKSRLCYGVFINKTF